MGQGSAVAETGILWPENLALGKWHRSKERTNKNYSPFGFYMLNKKWTMEEEFNNHLMMFVQVTVISIYFSFSLIFQAGLGGTETHFKEVEEEGKNEPLKMEHFHLSLGMWFVGILISILCFIAEIINHHVRKSKTVVPLTAALNQSTPE